MDTRRIELADLRRRHADQVAYGVRGTHTANRIAQLEDELRPVWLRVARNLGFWAFVLAYCGLFWFVIGAGVWRFAEPLIRGIMGHG